MAKPYDTPISLRLTLTLTGTNFHGEAPSARSASRGRQANWNLGVLAPQEPELSPVSTSVGID